MIVLAHRAEQDPAHENEQHPRWDAIPFASERRYMATLDEGPNGKRCIYVKGAPERILEMCGSEQRGDQTGDLDADRWRQRVDEIAERGQRVLAVAR